MNPTRSLIETLKSLIERTYGIPPHIGDLAPFIIGDRGYLALYGSGAIRRPGEARVLVRDAGGLLRAAIYCPDTLVRHLERFNPMEGLGDVNIQAFAVLVEELDHLLTLASRAAEGRRVTLLELEHHANVTKYLTVLHFLGRQTGRGRVREPLRQWARHHLFERYSEEGGREQRRYVEAARLAWQYLKVFETLSRERRRDEIRAFHRRPFRETLLWMRLN